VLRKLETNWGINRDNDVEAKRGYLITKPIHSDLISNLTDCKGLKQRSLRLKRERRFDREILTNITIFARVCG